MTDTRPLPSRWHEYRSPDYVPRAFVDEIRHALLTTGRYEVPEDREDTASASVSILRRLGYRIDVEDRLYLCANPSHNPTARQWETYRSRGGGTDGASSRIARREDAVPSPPIETNGSSTLRRRGTKTPGPSPTVAAMLPNVADVLVVAAVGFTRDGIPFLDAVGADGRRYSCRISSTDVVS